MPYSKNIQSYPAALREAIFHLAKQSHQVELPLPYGSKREAVVDRAKFYHLRKLIAEKAEQDGNLTFSESIYSVGMKLQENPDGSATLTLFNQASGMSSSAESVLKAFLANQGGAVEEKGHTAAAPIEDDEFAKYQEELIRRAKQEEEHKPFLEMYSAPEITEGDKATEEDIEAFRRAKEEWDKDDNETIHAHNVKKETKK